VASPPAGLQQHGETIATAFTFCSVPKPVIGLRELRRVLKPDGQLIMIEHVRSAIGPLGIFMDFSDAWLDVVKIILGRRWKSGAIYSLSLARAGVRAPRRTTSAAGRPAALPVLAK
jgi:ubiquinone/menaquinone biosynthesis C-methylase UbiE